MSTAPDLTDFVVVLVTTPSQAEAEAIANTLVTEQLAACVSISSIQSVYTWEGQLHQEPEWQLMIKTCLPKYAALESKLRQIHSYQVPEIIALPILAGSQAYLQWIRQQTR